ncbi:MAG: hypothetical protein JXQ67_07755 [Campylobacterales bacterium]|nr:hypothetical protein [Campylobacterales bacterium]
MTKVYKVSIFYFLLFTLALLATAIALFSLKIGFSKADVLHYYLGDAEHFIVAKTALGILKIILPHIFAFGLFMMVLLHFLVFTEYRNSKQLRYTIYTAYITVAAELFSPFFILAGIEFFAYVKIAAFFLMSFIQVYLSYLLFHSLMQKV